MQEMKKKLYSGSFLSLGVIRFSQFNYNDIIRIV